MDKILSNIDEAVKSGLAKAAENAKNSEIECPFCPCYDFDLIGLKNHLLNHCEGFENTMTIEQEKALREGK